MGIALKRCKKGKAVRMEYLINAPNTLKIEMVFKILYNEEDIPQEYYTSIIFPILKKAILLFLEIIEEFLDITPVKIICNSPSVKTF